MDSLDFQTLLRRHGGRATPGRIRLIEELWREKAPVTVARLQEKLGKTLNIVTLYRALDALVSANIVRKVDFRHGHAHYELNAARAHHHHLSCTNCGIIEDVRCPVRPRLKKSSAFKIITDHAMEYFGICKTCDEKAGAAS